MTELATKIKDMDIRTFCKRFMLWTAVIVAVVLLILGLCFGKIIEANIYEEVGKWIVMGLFIICSCEALAYTLSQFFYHGSKWEPMSKKNRELKDKMKDFKYNVYESDLKLVNSYLVSKVFFTGILEQLKYELPDHSIWNRSISSLRREWATHNLSYALGIKRERTKDVDLDTNQKWYTKLMYAIIGTLAICIIK